MIDRSRRELLCTASGALVLAAGCIADDLGGSPDSDDDPEENGDSGENDETGSDGPTNDESTDDEREDSVETRAFRHPDPTPEPTGVLFLESEDATGWLEDRRIDGEAEDAVAEFVDETPFEQASLVALEASAPNLCYELELESAAIEEGRLELEAVVADESDDGIGCAQQETTVGYLIRASAGGEPVREASATVVDRDGAEHDLEIDAESERDGDGNGDDGDEGDEDDGDGTDGDADE